MEQFNLTLDQKTSRAKVKEGINLAADLVVPTLGHSSRRILLDAEFGELTVSDDGTSILNEINHEDTKIQLGVKVAKEASAKTNNDEGDGTTTTCAILRELVNELLKGNEKDEIIFGANSGSNLKVRKEIAKGLEKVLDYIDKNKIEITNNEQVEFVGNVSSNDKFVGSILAEIFEKLGKDGAVSVEESKKVETTYSIVEGMSFNQGWLAQQFVTDVDREEAVLDEDVSILVSAKKLQDIDDIKKVGELFTTGVKNLFIIADDVTGIPLSTLVNNKLLGNIRTIVVKAPVVGNSKDILQDICVATGATLIGDTVQIADLTKGHLGRAERVVVTKDKTVIVGFGGKKETIDERIKQLEHRLEETESDYEQKKLKDRISKLRAGVGSIKVGGNTPLEIKDKKAKVDDAVAAVRSALRGGIVPGGGVALLQASTLLSDEGGEGILKRAIQKPFEQILENADVEDIQKVKAQVLETGHGYNVATEEFGDLVKMGIIDPADVVKAAVRNATSEALMVSNLGGAIVNVRKKDKDK